MQALFREVWSLEPCAVLVELGSWPPMVERNFLWWKYRPYHSFVHVVRNYWEDRQLASMLLDVLLEYGEGYAMNEGPRVSIFRNREGEDLSFFEPF